MNESIYFPEERIPEVCRVIRRGLKGEKDKDTVRQLTNRVEELEEYWGIDKNGKPLRKKPQTKEHHEKEDRQREG